MSALFCFGCNYPGEEHDERCPEFVDVERLVEQRDRLRAQLATATAELQAALDERDAERVVACNWKDTHDAELARRRQLEAELQAAREEIEYLKRDGARAFAVYNEDQDKIAAITAERDAALKRAEEAEREYDANQALNDYREAHMAMDIENRELVAEVDRLRAALRKYGQHSPRCKASDMESVRRLRKETGDSVVDAMRALQRNPHLRGPCDCGLDAALAASTTAERGEGAT